MVRLLDSPEMINSAKRIRQDDMGFSDGTLFSLLFNRCNGVVSLGDDKGTLMHIGPQTRPQDAVEGRFKDESREYPAMHELYNHSQDVKSIHIYHSLDSCWSPESIEEAFASSGFHNMQHISVPSFREDKKQTYRDVLLDTKARVLYIFPYDSKEPIVVPFDQSDFGSNRYAEQFAWVNR
jgi:hypothetical protein